MSKKSKKFSQEQRYQITYNAMNKNQALLWQSFHENIITVAYGSAGTGKTYASMVYAAQQISLGNYDKVILMRPNVSTGKSYGYLPGDLTEKITPWMFNMLEYLEEFLGKNVVENWLHGNHPKIILQMLETIRGATFNNSIAILDEAQQLPWNILKTILTRIGDNSKLIIIGDPEQKDIKENGLEFMVDIMQKHNVFDIGIIKFNSYDCIRSELCKRLLEIFEYEKI